MTTLPEHYERPHLAESVEWILRAHGDNAEQVLREYRALAETSPLLMKDLELFGYGAETTFHENPTESAKREGMRQMWLRISALAQAREVEVDHLIDQLRKGEDQAHERSKLEKYQPGTGGWAGQYETEPDQGAEE